MRRVSAGEVLGSAIERAGLEREELSADVFVALRGSLRRRLREGWQFGLWPELMLCERRFFRPIAPPSGEAVTAGTERFVAETGKYYQALKDTTDFPIDVSTEEANDSWAECATEYSGDFWDDGTTYEVGDVVQYEGDYEFYQMHTAAVAGIAPTNGTAWGILTRFDRYVGYEVTGATQIGTVLGVTKFSPKLSLAPRPVKWSRSENGVQVLEDVPYVWIEFRQRAPEIKGAVWDSSKSYAVGAQVYFRDETSSDESLSEGNFFNCVSATAAGQSPETNGELWELVEIPAFLERFLIGALEGDYLVSDGQQEKGAAALQLARLGLEEEWMVVGGTEGLNERAEVLAR